MNPIKQYRAYCFYLINRSRTNGEDLAGLLLDECAEHNDMAFDIVFSKLIDERMPDDLIERCEFAAEEISQVWDS